MHVGKKQMYATL